MNMHALSLAEQPRPYQDQRDDKVPDLLRAMLMDEQTHQLQPKLSSLLYEDGFELVGEEVGLSPPVMLCLPCKKLMQQPPEVHDLENWEEEDESTQGWVPFHNTLSQVINCCYSARGSCRLCHLIWHGLCRSIRKRRRDYQSRFEAVLLAVQDLTRLDWFDDALKVCLVNMGHVVVLRLNLRVLGNFPDPDVAYIRHSLKHFNIQLELDATNLFGERNAVSLSNSTESIETFRQIEQWMNMCEHGHPECQPSPKKHGQPTRLIRITEAGTSFILKGDLCGPVRYVAISYRWGSDEKAYKLTSATFSGMKQNVPITHLPKTLRDACNITYRLGFEYLWIDRLCIFQDSPDDWQREASRMALVYSNASYTISTSCASDETDGCFRMRDGEGVQPMCLKTCPLFPHGSLYIKNSEPDPQSKDGALGHLAQRGWIFQERLLPIRVIYFSQEQVHWQCRQLEGSETMPTGFNESEWDLSLPRPHITAQIYSNLNVAFARWQSLVDEYSPRQLTYARDKLPAISGLANTLNGVTGNQLGPYLAGIWQFNVMQGLCWRVDFYEFSASSVAPNLPTQYLAPSWSWASVNAQTECIKFASEEDYEGFEPHVQLAEFKHAEMRLENDANPYGEVQDGRIILSGYLKPIKVKIGDGPFSGLILNSKGEDFSFIYRQTTTLDTQASISESATPALYCFPLLGSDRREDEIGIYCLLLVQNGSLVDHRISPVLKNRWEHTPAGYQRVGFAELELQTDGMETFLGWVRESHKQEIIIY